MPVQTLGRIYTVMQLLMHHITQLLNINIAFVAFVLAGVVFCRRKLGANFRQYSQATLLDLKSPQDVSTNGVENA